MASDRVGEIRARLEKYFFAAFDGTEDVEYLLDALASAERERDEFRAQLVEAAMRINCAGPVAHRIDILRQKFTEENEKLSAHLRVYEQALKAIYTTVRGDEKSECWTIRKWLYERDIFTDDIQGSKRLIEEVCKVLASTDPLTGDRTEKAALAAKEPALMPEKTVTVIPDDLMSKVVSGELTWESAAKQAIHRRFDGPAKDPA